MRQYELGICCLQNTSKQSEVGVMDGLLMGVRVGAAFGENSGENDGKQLQAIGGTMRLHEKVGREHIAPGYRDAQKSSKQSRYPVGCAVGILDGAADGDRDGVLGAAVGESVQRHCTGGMMSRQMRGWHVGHVPGRHHDPCRSDEQYTSKQSCVGASDGTRDGTRVGAIREFGAYRGDCDGAHPGPGGDGPHIRGGITWLHTRGRVGMHTDRSAVCTAKVWQ